MCTSLSYRDAAGKVYFGRTLELSVDLPYRLAFFPAGFAFTSHITGYAALEYAAKNAFFAVTMPAHVPKPGAEPAPSELKVLEGLNDKGLTFSLLSYPAAGGDQPPVAPGRSVLSASDLGSWALSQFSTVAEVKAALADQPLMLEALPILGGAVSPFHYVVHDASGSCLVVEFHRGVMSVYDNPVGVMTNGPEFSWHLTNLDNYTFLSNVDRSRATFGAYEAVQPDSGIATVGLPASNTSVGRFVRAVYYAQYAEKAPTPDRALTTLAHIMNNFDRPRGITIDYPDGGAGHLEVRGLSTGGSEPYATEYSCWTSLADLDRRLLLVRGYGSLNFSRLDLTAFAGVDQPRVLPFSRLDAAAVDTTGVLRGARV